MSGAEEDPVLEGPRVDSTLHPGLRRHDDDARRCILEAPEQVTCMHRAIFELGQAEADQSVNLAMTCKALLKCCCTARAPERVVVQDCHAFPLILYAQLNDCVRCVLVVCDGSCEIRIRISLVGQG